MISSASNAQFKLWKSLLEPRGIKKNGLFLLFGEKVVNETLRNHREQVTELIEIEKTLSKELFRELDIFGTNSSIAVCRAPEFPRWREEKKREGLTLLCPLGDPSNLGALLRTACAFDVNSIVLLQEAASPLHPKALRASSGSIFSLPLYQGPSIHELDVPPLLALDAGGANLVEFHWPKDPLLLVGEEGPGIPSNLKCQKLSIPLQNGVESLNATVAAAIALFHFSSSVFGR